MSEEKQKVPIKFIVRRRFKYGKLWLNPGDPFIPAGGRFDEGIMKSNLVKPDLGEFRAPARNQWRKSRTAVRIGSKAAANANNTLTEALQPKPAPKPIEQVEVLEAPEIVGETLPPVITQEEYDQDVNSSIASMSEAESKPKKKKRGE